MNAGGVWWAATPREYWDHPDGLQPDEQPGWHTRFGDRVQELVFIGQDMDEAAIRSGLDGCMLDKDRLDGDSTTWSQDPNPFPELQAEEEAA